MSEGSDAEDTTLLGTGTWTKQGPATLVLRENAWVVLVPGLRKQVIEAAWTVLGEKPDPEDFLDRLVEAGELESADKLTALLFGFHDGTRAVFGVKGKTPIAVYTAEGSQQIAGTEDDPFVLRTLEDVRRTAFGELPLEDGLGAPRVESGIVPVRGFVHVTRDPAELEESERAALLAQVGQDGRSIEDPETKRRRAERPAPRTISSVAAAAPSRPAASPPATGAASSAPSRGTAGSSTASRAAAEPESSAPNMFDGLFGGGAPKPDATPTGPAEAPAPSPAAPAAVAGTTAPAAAEQASPTAAAPAPSAAPAAESPAPAATGAQAGSSGSGTAAPRTGRKRRLVSSSLFDRTPRSAPQETPPAEDPETTAAPTPSSKAAEPAPDAPYAESPAAAPTPQETSAASAATPAPTPPVSIPTPEPPEDDDLPGESVEDQLQSPITQIAPVDDEGDQDEAPTPAPRRAPAPRTIAPVAAGNDLENTGAYDDLFGKTVFRRIEDAAVRRAEEDEESEADEESTPGEESTADEESARTGPDSAAASPAPPASPSRAEPDAAPAPDSESQQTAAPSEFIDWVPGVGRTAPEIARTAARRAAAPSAPEPAYPQVQMAERPPAPNTGSRPAPTRPSMPAQPPAPYEQPGSYPPQGPPMNTGAAGQQLGYQAGSGPPSQYPEAPVDPGAAGHQVGVPSPPSAGGHGGRNASARGWTGSPNPPRPPQHGGAMPQNMPPQQSVPGQSMPPRQGTAPHPDPPPQHRTPPPQGMTPRPGMPSQHGMPPQQGMSPRQAMPPQQSMPPQGAARQEGRPSPALSAAGPGQAAGHAVTLPGLVCANGHANSPERAACRACGAPLQGATRTVARPPLGLVLVSGGERFVLDRTAIIGRRPRASRVSGNDVPQLITVPSPQQDISRSHLELRLEGWHVVALDLGTTNGTTLYREGFEPVRLRPREGVVLHDRDHLDLGDDVHLTFGERA